MQTGAHADANTGLGGQVTEADSAVEIWKGLFSFGLVSIPVELFPAAEKKGFKFSMLDTRDFRSHTLRRGCGYKLAINKQDIRTSARFSNT